VKSIVQFISDVTGKDFTYMDKHFTVELTQGNFDEILKTLRQYKLVILYTSGKFILNCHSLSHEILKCVLAEFYIKKIYIQISKCVKNKMIFLFPPPIYLFNN
jgi:hypothetical protein